MLLSITLAAAVVQADNYPFSPNRSAGLGNPWLGWVPYQTQTASNVLPHALENEYFAWSDLMKGFDSFDFSIIKDAAERAASRNNQLILRVYADYPGGQPQFAVPDFLVDGLAICNYPDYGGGKQPDYSNATLVHAMELTIAALGAAFDKDPRIGFVQAGFLGHWAEWHSEVCPFAPQATQATVLRALVAAFPNTFVLLRYADVTGGMSLPMSLPRIGLHDDSFGQDTIGPDSWQFLQRMVASNSTMQWKTAPIGGELRPEIQKCIFAADPTTACAFTGLVPQDITACITEVHSSWQWASNLFNLELDAADFGRALDAAALMGYSLSPDSLTVTAAADGTVTLAYLIHNHGVAPSYYNIDASVHVVDASGERIFPLGVAPTPLNELLPDGTTQATMRTPISIAWTGEGTARVGLALSSTKALKPIRPASEGVGSDNMLWVTVSKPKQ